MLKALIFIAITTLLTSCNVVHVYHISDVKKIKNYYLLYTLPKNEIIIDFYIEKTYYIKGPYANYAKKFLGIDNAIISNKIEYKLKNIDIRSNLIPDSEQAYVVEYKNNFPWECFSQMHNGIITAINTKPIDKVEEINQYKENFYEPELADLIITELTKKPIVFDKIDTVFKQVKVDTIWTKVPIQHKRTDTLKLEDMAREAANLIFDIRSRLFDLFSGEMETLPQDDAAEVISNELRKQEKEYLELFIGKIFKTTFKKSFKIIPDKNEQNLYLISYFSENEGFSDLPQKNYKPLLLQVKSDKTLNYINQNLAKLEKNKNHKYFYFKSPTKALVKILLDDEVLFEKEMWLYQNGLLQKIPIKLLKKKAFYIDNNYFYINSL